MDVAALNPPAWGRRVVARPWWAFAVWGVVVSSIHLAIWSGAGWPYFVRGSHALFSMAGLHVYAAQPDLQIGPLTFVAVAPFTLGLPTAVGKAVAMVLMSLAGLAVLAFLRRLVPDRDVISDQAFLLGGLCFLTLWAELAVTYAHADDVLAILFVCWALTALTQLGRPVIAALLLGLAADCKPWAVAFVALLLLVEPGRRRAAWLTWGAVLAAAWLPFVLADRSTLTATTYRIANSPASTLRVFGVDAAGTPSWDRPAQILLGVVLALLVLRRGRWSAVLLVVVAARLLLDPSVKSYYDAGLVAGCLLVDLVLVRARAPMLAISSVLVFYLPMFALHSAPHVYGLIRTAWLITAVGAVVILPDAVLRADEPAPASVPAEGVL